MYSLFVKISAPWMCHESVGSNLFYELLILMYMNDKRLLIYMNASVFYEHSMIYNENSCFPWAWLPTCLFTRPQIIVARFWRMLTDHLTTWSYPTHVQRLKKSCPSSSCTSVLTTLLMHPFAGDFTSEIINDITLEDRRIWCQLTRYRLIRTG